jgi:phosphinothricin acetyltransferase
VILRDATADDAPRLAEIYGHHVLHGLGTFEETPPPVGEIAARLGAIQGRALPYLVAQAEGGVVGFAYASPFRGRAAYRYTVEDSVYVAQGKAGQGIGKALVQAVIDRCEALGLRQMIAIIGDSGNAGSVGLHRSLGFDLMAAMPAVGFKHGRWVDIVWMQRALGVGASQPPSAPGLDLSGA